MKKLFIIFLGIIFLVGCRSIDERNEECIENMPVEVRQYVREFIEDGKQRGHTVRLKNLRIILQASPIEAKNGGDANAQTNTILKTITICTTTEKWKTAPKELIYHELGHAVLGLDHFGEEGTLMHKRGTRMLSESDLDAIF